MKNRNSKILSFLIAALLAYFGIAFVQSWYKLTFKRDHVKISEKAIVEFFQLFNSDFWEGVKSYSSTKSKERPPFEGVHIQLEI